MNKRRYFIISTSILFIIALANVPALNAVTYERDWNVGTVLEYTLESVLRDGMEATNDTHFMTFELEANYMLRLNITEIDELNEAAIVEVTVVGDSPEVDAVSFSAYNSSNDLADNFYNFYYYWDYNFNRAILTSFGIGFYSLGQFILEPDWTIFNENFVTVLDENQTIAALDTGYEIQYIYLSDFLEEISFNINGKSNLVEARNSFTPATSKWTFEFDISKYLLYPEYNSDEAIYEYHDYEQYEVKFELEYTKGGILSKMSITQSTSITRDNVKYIGEEIYTLTAGNTGTASISYNLLSVLVVLVLLPMLLPIRKKRKSN